MENRQKEKEKKHNTARNPSLDQNRTKHTRNVQPLICQIKGLAIPLPSLPFSDQYLDRICHCVLQETSLPDFQHTGGSSSPHAPSISRTNQPITIRSGSVYGKKSKRCGVLSCLIINLIN
ncbi:hypothetical protein Peur_019925 [Populus x canadensis]